MVFARYVKHAPDSYFLYNVELFVQTKKGKIISIGGFNCKDEMEFKNATDCVDYVLTKE